MRTSHRRASLALGLLTALAALAAGAVALIYAGRVPFNYPDRGRYPVWGLDVSNHQGEITWARVDTARYRFVYIKATEGGDFRDRRFLTNWEGAGRAGLARGAYHFFRFCTAAHLQATNFIGALPADAELPPVLDVESSGNCHAVESAPATRARIDSVLDAVEAATGRVPVIYTDHPTYEAFLAEGDYQRYPLWYNSKLQEPGRPFGHPWTLWQFTRFERVPGIEGGVDFNAFAGSRADFRRFASPQAEP